jgi:hypothetical protein
MSYAEAYTAKQRIEKERRQKHPLYSVNPNLVLPFLEKRQGEALKVLTQNTDHAVMLKAQGEYLSYDRLIREIKEIHDSN